MLRKGIIMSEKNKKILLLFIFAAILFAGGILAAYKTDIPIYRSAGLAVLNGLNPYIPENISKYNSGNINFGFIYFPGAIIPSLLCAIIPENLLFIFFRIFQVLAALVFIAVWLKLLNIGSKKLIGFLLYVLVICTGAFSIAYISGNIPFFEQAFLWLGVYLLLRNNFWFGVCFALAGLAKGVPYIAALMIVFAVWQAKDGIQRDLLIKGFFSWILTAFILTAAGVFLTHGWPVYNSFERNSFNFVKKIGKKALSLGSGAVMVAYLLHTVAVLLLWLKYLNKDTVFNIMFSASAFMIIDPHSPYYGFVIIVPSVLYIFSRIPREWLYRNLFVLFAILTLDTVQQLQPIMLTLINNTSYITAYMTFINFCVFAHHIKKGSIPGGLLEA